MKRWIRANKITVEDVPVFIFNSGHKDFILRAYGSNITDKIVRRFVNALCDYKGVGDSIRNSALYDKAILEDFRRRITKGKIGVHSYSYNKLLQNQRK